MAYGSLAKVYEQLMHDAPYEEWIVFMKAAFEKYGRAEPRLIADLGCGTGLVTRKLAADGYEMIGVDVSEEMLAFAASQPGSEKVQWLHQDLRSLPELKADAAISMFDVINYVTEPDDIKLTFQKIYQTLKPGALFLFDVHAMEHVEDHLKGELFAEIYDDIVYTWICEEGNHEGEVFHDLTFFIRDEETSLYERFDEYHHQRTYSISQYKQWLKESGFTCLAVNGEFNLSADAEKYNFDRLFFVCQK